METALFVCPDRWRKYLPPGTALPEDPAALAAGRWDLLALTAAGCRLAGEGRCRILLIPGDCPADLPARFRPEAVVTYGLSPRDSLTLSSLTQPVLCVQRVLPRPGGGEIEPQEIPLPPLPEPAEGFLPLLGLRLLQIPLTNWLPL